MKTYDDTVAFIEVAHAGQTDKAGLPYVHHPIAVAQEVRFLQVQYGPLPGVDPQHEVLAALLHDVIEDTDHTAESLLAEGFHPDVIEMVVLVSKDPTDGLTYMQRIEALAQSGNYGAMRVKFADNKHNSLPERIAQLPVEMRSIAKRYKKSMRVLGEALKEAA